MDVTFTPGATTTSNPVIRSSNYNYVTTRTTGSLDVTSAAIGFDGLQATNLMRQGRAAELDQRTNSPGWNVVNTSGYGLESCSATNTSDFTVGGTGDGSTLALTFSCDDQPGVIATSPSVRLTSGRWDGDLSLSDATGPLGVVPARATLVTSGPSTRLSIEYPKRYVEEWVMTPMLLTFHADGIGSPGDVTCNLVEFRRWQRASNPRFTPRAPGNVAWPVEEFDD